MVARMPRPPRLHVPGGFYHVILWAIGTSLDTHPLPTLFRGGSISFSWSRNRLRSRDGQARRHAIARRDARAVLGSRSAAGGPNLFELTGF